MHTLNPEIQLPATSRRHSRYSDEFKRQVVAACLVPGVSKAAIALANGLNANMLRRWVVESSQGSDYKIAKLPTPLTPDRANSDFIPVKLVSPVPVSQADIRLELQHARGAIQIHWPIGASSQCAQWMREVLA
jgi:transposase-like protein